LEQIADIFEGNIMTGRAKTSSDLEGFDEKHSVAEEQVEYVNAEGK
jgi:hypothetical protein